MNFLSKAPKGLYQMLGMIMLGISLLISSNIVTIAQKDTAKYKVYHVQGRFGQSETFMMDENTGYSWKVDKYYY